MSTQEMENALSERLIKIFENQVNALERNVQAIEQQSKAVTKQVDTFKAYLEGHEKTLNEISKILAGNEERMKVYEKDSDRIFNDLYGSPESAKNSIRESLVAINTKMDEIKREINYVKEDTATLKKDFEEYKVTTNKYIIGLLLGLIGFIATSFFAPLILNKMIDKHGDPSDKDHITMTK